MSTLVRLRLPVADESFEALGTTVRLIGAPGSVRSARRAILGYHRRLSRFLPDSELSRLNADPRETVPASALLRDAVRAGLWAAERSGGLVDPCLLDALCAAGYERSGAVVPRPSGPARPAGPDPAARWRRIRVGEDGIVRPPGLRLDLGGSGKSHVADLVAAHFDGRFVVDCGGDIRVGGEREVEVEHPLGGPRTPVRVIDGAIATSSLARRGHHLIDPATGEPAWTGVLSATALAPTVLEAETLAKTALLLGTADVLVHGGLIVRAGGRVEMAR
jgi:thiamine biosynthesis lipoprotein